MSQDNDFLAAIREAIVCADEQQDRDLELLHRLDTMLTANDDQLRAELQSLMTRHHQRRALMREEAVDFVHQLVGVERDEFEMPRVVSRPPEPPPLPRSDYDYERDDLNLIGRRVQ